MRNYFKRLKIEPNESKESIKRALNQPPSKSMPAQMMDDASIILMNEATLRMYQQIYIQYEAMRAAQDCLESSPGVDTNHWQSRLGNFDIDPLEKL